MVVIEKGMFCGDGRTIVFLLKGEAYKTEEWRKALKSAYTSNPPLRLFGNFINITFASPEQAYTHKDELKRHVYNAVSVANKKYIELGEKAKNQINQQKKEIKDTSAIVKKWNENF
jgi:hypothetical protein